jgi:hypothetical protein
MQGASFNQPKRAFNLIQAKITTPDAYITQKTVKLVQMF